jgi:hypothetical protein
MDRRAFLLTLTGGLLAAPLAAAQQAAEIARIAFRQELRALGYVEGRTLAIEYRAAEENLQRLPATACRQPH